MDKHKILHKLYLVFFKPVAFLLPAEFVHEVTIRFGEFLENFGFIVEGLFAYKDDKLKKEIAGIQFENPIGLAAGFDYDGHAAKVLRYAGFGFNTVGTVTYLPYEGNSGIRLARLPKSKSLLVNKGFKSEGAKAVAKRLDGKDLQNHVIGISIGDRNGSTENIVKTFKIFEGKKYVKYFELNISCPNIAAFDAFYNPGKFEKLVREIKKLKLKKPIFVKMPNEISFSDCDRFVEIARENNINGFIFSNLIKDRSNKKFDKSEIEKLKDLNGNFSGKPTFENSNKLIQHIRGKFGKKVVIVGTGGVFNAKDVKEKLGAGADLVQLITGMIYEGPQLVGEICKDISSVPIP